MRKVIVTIFFVVSISVITLLAERILPAVAVYLGFSQPAEVLQEEDGEDPEVIPCRSKKTSGKGSYRGGRYGR